MLAQYYLWPRDCPYVTRWCCIEMAAWIELAFGVEISVDLSYTVIRKFGHIVN